MIFQADSNREDICWQHVQSIARTPTSISMERRPTHCPTCDPMEPSCTARLHSYHPWGHHSGCIRVAEEFLCFLDLKCGVHACRMPVKHRLRWSKLDRQTSCQVLRPCMQLLLLGMLRRSVSCWTMGLPWTARTARATQHCRSGVNGGNVCCRAVLAHPI